MERLTLLLLSRDGEVDIVTVVSRATTLTFIPLNSSKMTEIYLHDYVSNNTNKLNYCDIVLDTSRSAGISLSSFSLHTVLA